MSEVVTENNSQIVKTDGTEKIIQCENCGSEWSPLPGDLSEDTCPECGSTETKVVGEQILEYPKWVWDGADSVEGMAECLEGKAEYLRSLAEEGWYIEQGPADGHTYLRRDYDDDTKVNEA